MIFVMTLFLASQAASEPASPPPPVMATPEGERKFLDGLPQLDINGQSFRVFTLSGTGDSAEMNRAALKLSSEGWECNVAKDYTGILKLSVFLTGRTLADVRALASRFTAHEFGAIDMKPVLISDAKGK